MYCQTCGVARENGLVDSTLPVKVPFPSAPSSSSYHPSSDSGLAYGFMLEATNQYEPEVATQDLFFSAPAFNASPTNPQTLLSEHEVVERMYVNSDTKMAQGRRLEMTDFFSESEITERQRSGAAPSAPATQVVYDLPSSREPATATASPSQATATTHAEQVREPRPPASPKLEPATSLPTREYAAAETTVRRTNEPTAPPQFAPAPVSNEPVNHKAATTSTPASKPTNGPVQAVRFLNKPPKPTIPPTDKKLIKLIAVLVFFILVFSALIVSGLRLRDLVSLPTGTPLQNNMLAEASPAASVRSVQGSEAVPTGMVAVPGGAFRMGRDDGDLYESPLHEVTVAPFFMDRTEVTNAQYAEFVKATHHPAPPHWKDGKYPTGADKLPVVNVSWQDANAYATWAGKRLPTEAEWEYAARAQDARRYPWGSQWDATKANTSESNLNRPVEADSYADAANPFGLLQLSGNVWEWVNGEVVSYKDAKITLAPGKVIRGGAYYMPKERATTTYRGFAPADKVSERIGFRCVRDLN